MLVVCIVGALLFLINSSIAWTAYELIRDSRFDILQNDKFRQGSLLAVPVLMLFIQYIIYDAMIDRIFPCGEPTKEQKD